MEDTSGIYTSYMMPLSARSFFINVNQDTSGRLYGTISQNFCESDVPFYGLDDAIMKIDSILDELGCVQSSTELRVFSNSKNRTDECDQNVLKKETRIREENKRNTHIQYRETEELKEIVQSQMNSFVVEIMYRQHSSWQGNITWRNHFRSPRRKCFRSVLELMRLIRSSYEVR